MLEVRLAWRNVWRNPRRTVLCVAATVFAVFLVVFFVAMAAGSHEKMIEDSVRMHSGHVSLSAEGYRERQTLEEFLHLEPALVELLEATPDVRGWAPRLNGFGLLSTEDTTRGVAVVGVDPEREPDVTTLPARVVRGGFLPGREQREVVLGERLARKLDVAPGDEILLYSVAYTLEPAYELFTVAGVMRLPEPELDRGLAVVDLDVAQRFFVYGDRVSEVAVRAENADAAGPVRNRLAAGAAALGVDAEVLTWDEVSPALYQLIVLDDAQMYILLVVLVVVVGFGILNTILMAVLERQRELGITRALGMKPGAIFRMVYLESLFIAGVGLVAGLALALPTVLVMQANPIYLGGEMSEMVEFFGFEPVMTWKLKPLNPVGSTLAILGVAALAALYPALKASRARVVEALRTL